jgi:hypothetical protein
MMADMQALFRQVDALMPEESVQLCHYVIERMRSFGMEVTRSRILGLHAHRSSAWMSDDFNDELPDEFWFGEE